MIAGLAEAEETNPLHVPMDMQMNICLQQLVKDATPRLRDIIKNCRGLISEGVNVSS